VPDILIGVGVGVDVGVGVGVGVGLGVGDGPLCMVITPLVWLTSYELKASSIKMNSYPAQNGAQVRGVLEPRVLVRA